MWCDYDDDKDEDDDNRLIITDHFSDPGRAIGPVFCVFVQIRLYLDLE